MFTPGELSCFTHTGTVCDHVHTFLHLARAFMRVHRTSLVSVCCSLQRFRGGARTLYYDGRALRRAVLSLGTAQGPVDALTATPRINAFVTYPSAFTGASKISPAGLQ